MQLNLLIYNTTRRIITTTIDNVLSNKGLFIDKVLSTSYLNNYSKELTYSLILACFYRQSTVLTRYIALLIKRNKKHYQTIKKFVSILETLFYKEKLNI